MYTNSQSFLHLQLGNQHSVTPRTIREHRKGEARKRNSKRSKDSAISWKTGKTKRVGQDRSQAPLQQHAPHLGLENQLAGVRILHRLSVEQTPDTLQETT